MDDITSKQRLEMAGWNECELASAALALGAETVPGWSREETELAAQAVPVPRKIVSLLRDLIRSGEDPLGDLFAELRSPEVRRDLGATYTPASIVRAMMTWAKAQETPTRIVDPGVGSARFLMQAAATFPKAQLLGVASVACAVRTKKISAVEESTSEPQTKKPGSRRASFFSLLLDDRQHQTPIHNARLNRCINIESNLTMMARPGSITTGSDITIRKSVAISRATPSV